MDVRYGVMISWVLTCVREMDARSLDGPARGPGMRMDGSERRSTEGHKGAHELRPVRHTGNHSTGERVPPVRERASCCGEGGVCVLGSFCLCYRFYYGRHCDFYSEGRSCGSLDDGAIVHTRCRSCVCGDGYLTCYPKTKECGSLLGENSNKEIQYDFNSGRAELPSFLANHNSAYRAESMQLFYWTVLLFMLFGSSCLPMSGL